MNKIIKNFKKDSGQIAVIVAFLIVGIVGMLAYVVDVGSMYETRRHAQTAADSAALAGAQELPKFPDKAQDKAIEYAQEHRNVTLAKGDINFSTNFDTITVNTIDETTPLFFSGIYGLNSKTIATTATARVFSPRSLGKLVPWMAMESTYVFGQPVVLKSESKQTPGNFQAMDYDGKGGADAYRNEIINGADTEVFINQYYPIEPGNMAGPTGQGVDARIAGDTCKLNDITEVLDDGSRRVTDPGCPRIVLVPLTNDWVENPSEDQLVIGFAVFFIDKIEIDEVDDDDEEGKKQDQAKVTGQFIEELMIQSSGEVTEYTGGIKVIRLIN